MALAAGQAAGAATFTVTSTEDGPGDCPPICTLRGAIDAANATVGVADTIEFAIGEGAQTINLASALPTITDPVTIDGTTQPGWIGPPIIMINGADAGSGAIGLEVAAAGSTVRGLVISGFLGPGITLSGGGNVVEGNFIGTDMSGLEDFGNAGNGIIVFGGDNRIGGTTAAARNVVSGNEGSGINLLGASGTNVQGNYIGANANGDAGLPNDTNGVSLDEASGNTIGGTEGEGNLIAFNTQDGVAVFGFATGTRVLGNGIRDNGQLGIDLGNDGVTPNDPGDDDEGDNNLQNFPVLESAETNGEDSITIAGTLGTVAEQVARLEFFASTDCDPSEHGEGARFLGWTEIDTVGGSVDFLAGFEVPVAVGEAITATATVDGNTSELSKCFDATGLGGGGDALVVNLNGDTDDGACTTADCTLREAINAANATAGLQTIGFSIGGGGAQTIAPATALPAITDPVVIDGTTQPGYSGTPLIELDGTNAGPVDGLQVNTSGSTIKGLVVNRFVGPNKAGIFLGPGGGGNTVRGNFIGTDPTGKIALGNTHGVSTLSPDNVIGGTTAEARNVISGNQGFGIQISSGQGGDRTVVEGNYVGTDATGGADLGNASSGIAMFTNLNRIGGPTAASRNVVSGNGGGGITVFWHLSDGNTIENNFVGTAADGTTPVGNNDFGVSVAGSDNEVVQNTIANSASPGIRVYRNDAYAGATDPVGNLLSGNSISANSGLGIDLALDGGVTPNDPGDADAGANNLQNFPVVTSATKLGTNVVVSGELDSLPSTTFQIELFYVPTCDSSGNGEGGRFIGTAPVTTTPVGDASFSLTLALPEAGGFVTATATDPGGNTSEFSACAEIGLPGDVVAMTSPADCAPSEDGGRTITFEEAGEGPLAERYASLGVHFLDDETTTPILYANTEERQTSSNPTSAANDADYPGTSAGVPLTITFDEPQTAVGFFAGNAQGGPVAATIRAYGSDDVLLGTLQISIPVNDVTTFRGVLREDGGILKVTLDYGSSVLSEEIDDLCFLGPALAEGPDGLTLTVDAGSNPAGSATRLVPLSSIPANQLPSFSGSPAAAPVGSIPVGSIPVGSIPVGSIPVGSIPVGSIPVGSIPVGSIPVGSIPVGSIGLEAIPVGSIGLDQILLSSLPVDWGPIFAGTPKAGLPVQTLTLADVYDPANAPARARFEALTFAQSGLAQTLLGSVPLAALLLGEKHLNQLPPPEAPTWCAAIVEAGGDCTGLSTSTNTVVGLAISGAPVGSIPVGSIPVGSIAGGIAGTPVGSIPLRDIDIAATRLANIKLVDLPSPDTVVDCAALGGCTGTKTLGDAAAADAIRVGVTLSALQSVLGNITLNEIIIGLLPRSALAWEGFPLDGLQLFTSEPQELRYSVDFDLDCAKKAGLAVTVKLPDGYIVQQGSSTVKYGNAAAVNAPNPTTNARTGARWTGLPEPCGALATQHVKLSFDALSAFELRLGRASATVSAGGAVDRVTDQAPVLVTQNWEVNDDEETARAISPDQLVIGHIARSGDQEVFTTSIPSEPGTITTFYLSHIAEGADFDLVIGAPPTPPLQSNPVGSIPVGSIPVEDHGSGVDNSTAALAPETLQDVPVGSIPVGSISANRGNADEVAQVVSRGEEGVYTIVVRGYNGSFSREPFVLRVKRTPAVPLDCVDRGLSLGAAGSLPLGVAPETRSLFLVNRQRMEALYPGQWAAMRAQLELLAARDEVRGAILEVDGSTAVRAAYAAWDADPCDVEAANGVVRAINDVVAGYRGSLADLRYVVLLGTDEALPLARVPDRVSVSPAMDFEPDLRFTRSSPTQANALYASAARNYVLTDGAYGAFTRIEWLGRELYLPQVSVSRLVESSDDIRLQIEQYLDPLVDGKLDAQTAFASDYDFLDDGGQAVFDALAGLVTTATHLENTWDRQDLVDRFTGKAPPDDVNSVNAHYSQWQIQPQTAATAADLVTTADVPAPGVEPAFRNRILFTMGCNANFNIPNTYFAPGAEPQQARDWAEIWARQRAAVYVANTSFGYGDTVANALSERLMTIFAQNLGRDETIGEIHLRSLHDYFVGAGAYDVYDEKVLIETSLRGLPFWQIDGAVSPPPPTPPTLEPDAESGLEVARLTITPGSTRNEAPPRGSFWSSLGNTQVTHFRPVQPRAERDVTVPGLVAHGVVIKALSTTDVGGVDPVLATPTIDLSENEPEPNFRPPYWPASFVNLTRSRQLGAERQKLVINGGQFRANDPPGETGTERVVTSISVDVLYSSSPDFVPPAIHQVSSVFTGGTVRIFVRATDDSGTLRRATALVNDGSGWRFLELTLEGELFTGTLGGLAREPEVAVTVQDGAGNTGQSTNKAVNHTPTTDTDGPDILIESPRREATYTLNQNVASLYFCSEAAGVQTCAGPVPSGQPIDTSTPGRRAFTVNATSFTGAQSSLTHEYLVQYAFEGFLPPVDNPPVVNRARAGQVIPVKWRLRDANGAYIRDLASVKSITSRQISCPNAAGDEVEDTETGSVSGLEYVLAEELFKYHWRTLRAWRNTCRRITVELADGTKPFADFSFR